MRYPKDWLLGIPLDEARSRTVATITVLGRPKRKEVFSGVGLIDYKALFAACYPRERMGPGAYPVEFNLTIMAITDLAGGELTIVNASRTALGYMGQAMEDTQSARDSFARARIDCATKKSGNDLAGRAGH